GAGGAPSSAGSAGAPARATLGAACETYVDCDPALRCEAPSSTAWAGRSPAHGYCTVDCSVDRRLCQTIQPNALCYPFTEGSAFCLEACAYGPAGQTSFSADKCHGRSDVACMPVVTFEGKHEIVTP